MERSQSVKFLGETRLPLLWDNSLVCSIPDTRDCLGFPRFHVAVGNDAYDFIILILSFVLGAVENLHCPIPI